MLQEKWLVFSDVHGPWDDPRKVELILDIGQDIGVTHVAIVGDLVDFTNLSTHSPKSPDIPTTLEQEFDWGIEFFNKLRKRFPTQEILFIHGNHEWRLDRFILKQSRPFWNILTTDKQLQTEHFKIRTLPYNMAYQIPGTDIRLQHSPPSYSQNAAKTSAMHKMTGRWIWGCTHRPDSAFVFPFQGAKVETHCMGWLGTVDLTPEHFEVFRWTKGHERWGSSFCVIDIVKNLSHITHVVLDGYSCVLNGVYYEG